MKQIKESPGPVNFPRKRFETIEARKRDLIFRITDWTKDKEEPAYDVEVYIGGVYDYDESKSCTFHEYGNKRKAKLAAIEFASEKIKKLL
jgi:hypothetical protein